MKKVRLLPIFVFLLMAALLVQMPVAWAAPNTGARLTATQSGLFPDTRLEAAIRNKIHKPTGELTSFDVQSITDLDIRNQNISSLEGLQYCVSLRDLRLSDNVITDVSPLRNLHNLYQLILDGNKITDISALSNLTNLKYLWLYGNQIRNIRPLSNLTQLVKLFANGNQISDVTPLTALHNITNLQVWYMTSLDKMLQTQKKAQSIVAALMKPGMSDLEKMLIVHDYVVSHNQYDYFNYKNNSIPEDSRSAYGVFLKGTSVCGGYANAIQILALLSGIECYHVIGSANNDSHAWNIVKINGTYWQLDATFDDPSDYKNPNYLLHSYFNLSDVQLSVDHQWDRSKYPVCGKMGTAVGSLGGGKVLPIGSTYLLLSNNRIYRTNKSGSIRVQVTGNLAVDMLYVGGWVYYINASANWTLYKMKPDGSGQTKLGTTPIRSLVGISGTSLISLSYYHAQVLRTNISTGKNSMLASKFSITWAALSGGKLYFKGFNWDIGSGIFRMNTDGKGITRLSKDKPSGFTVKGSTMYYTFGMPDISLYGGWIYFINTSDGNKLYRISTTGTGRVRLSNTAINRFDVIYGTWLDYKTTKGTLYRVKSNGTGTKAI